MKEFVTLSLSSFAQYKNLKVLESERRYSKKENAILRYF